MSLQRKIRIIIANRMEMRRIQIENNARPTNGEPKGRHQSHTTWWLSTSTNLVDGRVDGRLAQLESSLLQRWRRNFCSQPMYACKQMHVTPLRNRFVVAVTQRDTAA